MFKVGINFDEISDDLTEAMHVMQQEQVSCGEIRTIHKKNFIFFSDDELRQTKHEIDEAGIELIAGASPLFKWYTRPDFTEVPHDNFGFNPRLSEEEKKKSIDRGMECAKLLGIQKLRIFSNLDDGTLAIDDFVNDPMLAYALEQAKKANVMLLVENEPVCVVRRKQDILSVFQKIDHPNLGLWLDIANLEELDEVIDEAFIKAVADKIAYLHVKDFKMEGGKKVYYPLGQGSINYAGIFAFLARYLGDSVCVTVETHVPSDRMNASILSIRQLKELIEGANT